MLSPDQNPAGCVDADPGRQAALPLCVDLDGTLIHGDLLWECIVLLLKKNPFSLLLLPFWLVSGGRANVKRQAARRVSLEPGNIAYNREVLDFLQAEHRRGRPLVLVTAADQQLAEAVAAHTGLFHRVHGSREGQNLKGRAKAELLRATFGVRGFDYAGDSSSDMHVWSISSGAYVVGSETTAERAASVTEVRRWFPRRKRDLSCWTRAIRVHHWSKNLLMLVPILLAHRLSWQTLLLTLVGTLLFGLCSSGVYILNDLLDLHSDRAHPWKSTRPFATGELSIASGIVTAALLFGASLGLGTVLLNGAFAGALAFYAVIATWYSLRLKKVAVLDVFVLSSFYVIRIWAGALITATPLSQWFLGFSLFFFLSLAMAKRYSELVHAADLADSGNSGRSYRAGDRALLMSIGMASCFSAIVILSLYVHSNEVMVLYRRPELLLLLCPLILYWTCRIWLKAQRGELNEDPVTLAMRDPVSYGVAAAGLAIMLSSSIRLSL
jgi:4-hydroxybenzoate polyprenyltransferase